MLIGTVSQWYRDDFGFSSPLIDGFVRLMEDQAEAATQKYESDKKIETVENELSHIGIAAREIVIVGGFDSDSYNLESIWKDTFPSLVRRSAFITVYGYFEHELTRLCYIFKNEKEFRLSPTDLKDDGIERAVNYLWKVANLNVQKGTAIWESLSHIRSVRNAVVHRDGGIRDQQRQVLPELSKAITCLKHIRSNGFEVILEKGFVEQVVDIFTRYFKLIDDSIQAAENPQALRIPGLSDKF
jgi:hypothetical protein